MKHLKHPHIVQYIQKYHDKRNSIIYIVMEYCQNGDLQQFIKKHKQTRQYLPEGKILNIFIQILLGLDYCHYPPENVFHSTESNGNFISKQIIHRDLKPTNIFIKSNGDLAIADFGLCRTIEENQFAQTVCGSPLYSALEVLQKKPYTASVDIYSLGTILYELLTYQPPYVATTQESLKIKIQQGIRCSIPSCYSQDIIYLVNRMLSNNPMERPTTKQILNEPFIKNAILQAQQIEHGQLSKTQVDYVQGVAQQHVQMAYLSPAIGNQQQKQYQTTSQLQNNSPQNQGQQQQYQDKEQYLKQKEEWLQQKENKLRLFCNQLNIDFDSL